MPENGINVALKCNWLAERLKAMGDDDERVMKLIRAGGHCSGLRHGPTVVHVEWLARAPIELAQLLAECDKTGSRYQGNGGS